jgi:uncharacterized protein (UPF0218 family)
MTRRKPRFDSRQVLNVDIPDAMELIDGLGKAGHDVSVKVINRIMSEHLGELRVYLINHRPRGIPKEVDLKNAISISVSNGIGTISVDTRTAIDETDLSDPPTQEKKNVAWFLEYGQEDMETATPFLAPLINANMDRLKKKLGNAVISSLEQNIRNIKVKASYLRNVGDVEASNQMNRSTGGLTKHLNSIKALYGENLPAE